MSWPLAANLSLLFPELPLIERVVAARQAGFEGVEIQFPYDTPVEQLASALAAAELPLVLINLPAGDFTQGGPGLAAVPARQDEFDAALAQAAAYAAEVRPQRVNVLPGRLADGVERASALACLVANLRRAADAFAELRGLGAHAPCDDATRVTLDPKTPVAAGIGVHVHALMSQQLMTRAHLGAGDWVALAVCQGPEAVGDIGSALRGGAPGTPGFAAGGASTPRTPPSPTRQAAQALVGLSIADPPTAPVAHIPSLLARNVRLDPDGTSPLGGEPPSRGASTGAGDLAQAVRTAVISKRAGGMGLISGRKAFQKPLADGVALLNAIQDVYLCDDVTIA